MEGDSPWAQLETESPLPSARVGYIRVIPYDVHALHVTTVSQFYSGL